MANREANIVRVNDRHYFHGTALRGLIVGAFEDLVAVFGDPHTLGSYDGKTQCQWGFTFGDGCKLGALMYDSAVFTIYDWRIRGRYQDCGLWHVGGRDGVGKRVADFIELRKDNSHASSA